MRTEPEPAPWSDVTPPSREELPPTMLSGEELRYLVWLGESVYQGWGAMVDLGPWLGGSACALAEGMGRQDRQEKVHAFDNFVWERHYMERVHAADLPDHSDFRPLFDRFTRAWAPWIDARAADLRHARWDGGPIEILFVDAAKDWELANNILAGFGHALVPGRSLVVLQDYQLWATYFLPLIFESRPDLWEPVHTCAQGNHGELPPAQGGGGAPAASRSATAAPRFRGRSPSRSCGG